MGKPRGGLGEVPLAPVCNLLEKRGLQQAAHTCAVVSCLRDCSPRLRRSAVSAGVGHARQRILNGMAVRDGWQRAGGVDANDEWSVSPYRADK